MRRSVSMDKTWWFLKARDKRKLAAFARQAADMVSLKDDREALLAEAVALEAEASRIERDQGICDSPEAP
jgi:hypothetical protein